MPHRLLTPLFVALGLASLACGGARRAASATPTSATAPALSEAAHALSGTWRCTGAVFGPEGPSASTVVVDARLVLDGAWLQTDFAVTDGRYPYRFTALRTFDASSATWVSLIADNLGGHTVSRSADGITWLGSSRTPMCEVRIRDSETMISPGRMQMRGEYSTDDGASWSTGYELSCEK